MIVWNDASLTDQIKNIWLTCFGEEERRYTEFFFKYVYKPEYGYAIVEDGEVLATACRIPHSMMLKNKVIKTSMIVGVATLPEYQHQGHMHTLMDIVLSACENQELVTLIQAYDQALYKPFGFKPVFQRKEYTYNRSLLKRVSNIGCGYDPSALDMLKCFSAYIRRFDGYYIRDIESFVRYKREISAQGGKILSYYDSKGHIKGYATILPEKGQLKIEELVYLDSKALAKLLNSALTESDTVVASVSTAENLSLLMPDIGKPTIVESTMAKINDIELFEKLYGEPVLDIKEALSSEDKPLNLNEFM